MGNLKKERVRGQPKLPPSPADQADAQGLDRAVEAMIQNVLSGWDHTRPLGSLTRGDLRTLATHAVIGFIQGKQECDRQFRESGRLTDVPFAMPI